MEDRTKKAEKEKLYAKSVREATILAKILVKQALVAAELRRRTLKTTLLVLGKCTTRRKLIEKRLPKFQKEILTPVVMDQGLWEMGGALG